jgi:c-di-GMP-binding flagellar brake protein YcgR
MATEQTNERPQDSSFELGRLGRPFFFPIGIPLLIEVEGVTVRMKSTSIGYFADHYLIMKYPAAPMSLSTVLTKGRKITVRYLDNGSVFAFQSGLIAAIASLSVLFVSYPSRLVRHSLRSARRLDCFLPATIVRDSQAPTDAPLGEGVIVDISGTGCGFTAGGSPDGEGLARLSIGDTVILAFKLPGAEEDVRMASVVKRMQQDAEKTNIGLQFNEVEESLKVRITEFVSTLEKFTWET